MRPPILNFTALAPVASTPLDVDIHLFFGGGVAARSPKGTPGSPCAGCRPSVRRRACARSCPAGRTGSAPRRPPGTRRPGRRACSWRCRPRPPGVSRSRASLPRKCGITRRSRMGTKSSMSLVRTTPSTPSVERVRTKYCLPDCSSSMEAILTGAETCLCRLKTGFWNSGSGRFFLVRGGDCKGRGGQHGSGFDEIAPVHRLQHSARRECACLSNPSRDSAGAGCSPANQLATRSSSFCGTSPAECRASGRRRGETAGRWCRRFSGVA